MNLQNLHAERHRQATLIDGSHAIVIGGSLAGLLAARVLADHFNLVTIIERDRNASFERWRFAAKVLT